MEAVREEPDGIIPLHATDDQTDMLDRSIVERFEDAFGGNTPRTASSKSTTASVQNPQPKRPIPTFERSSRVTCSPTTSTGCRTRPSSGGSPPSASSPTPDRRGLRVLHRLPQPRFRSIRPSRQSVPRTTEGRTPGTTQCREPPPGDDSLDDEQAEPLHSTTLCKRTQSDQRLRGRDTGTR